MQSLESLLPLPSPTLTKRPAETTPPHPIQPHLLPPPVDPNNQGQRKKGGEKPKEECSASVFLRTISLLSCSGAAADSPGAAFQEKLERTPQTHPPHALPPPLSSVSLYSRHFLSDTLTDPPPPPPPSPLSFSFTSLTKKEPHGPTVNDTSRVLSSNPVNEIEDPELRAWQFFETV